MRIMLALVLVLCSGAAMAQSSQPATAAPPAVAAPATTAAPPPGDKPPAQAKSKKTAAAPAPAQHLSIAKRLQACLEIDDGTKGRLDCYDAVIAPKPNPKAPAAKGVADCRFKKEEDERLNCFNGFAESIPKF
jgi:hypothetical protein